MKCLAYRVSPIAIRVLQAAGWAEAGGLGPGDCDAWYAAAINFALHERRELKEAQKPPAENGQGGVRFVGLVPTHRGAGG